MYCYTYSLLDLFFFFAFLPLTLPFSFFSLKHGVQALPEVVTYKSAFSSLERATRISLPSSSQCSPQPRQSFTASTWKGEVPPLPPSLYPLWQPLWLTWLTLRGARGSQRWTPSSVSFSPRSALQSSLTGGWDHSSVVFSMNQSLLSPLLTFSLRINHLQNGYLLSYPVCS